MADQLDLFAATAPVDTFPQGFRYQRELITPEVEAAVLAAIQPLPFKDFEFHGYVGKRRTISFGWSYDFATESLQRADDMPPILLQLREAAAAFAGIASTDLTQVLVTEYGENAAIGWHRDKAVFREIVGISLLSTCHFRLRRQAGDKWQRVTIEAEPRSAYLLSGAARTEWEHSIPPVDTRRYSITYRSLAAAR